MKKELVIKLGLLFYFCNILGYLYELLLHFIYNGSFFSHGILHGPWLPIYGSGSLLIMSIYKYKNKPILIFLLSFFITGLLEYLSGLLLLKILNIRLWDYTGMFLNISGHVCFLSALCFGLGGLLITYVIYPFIEKIYLKIKDKYLKLFLSSISIIFLIDIIATIIK